jgi:hypothetical protein
MDLKKSVSKRSLHTPLICQICGDIARGMNFDVITCMSCKAFFRRHALRSGVSRNLIKRKKISMSHSFFSSCLEKCALFT